MGISEKALKKNDEVGLGAFLDYFNLRPAKIVSFDDDKNALLAIAWECKKREISFVGYWYQGAKNVEGTFMMKRSLAQLDHIMNSEKWLTDDAMV